MMFVIIGQRRRSVGKYCHEGWVYEDENPYIVECETLEDVYDIIEDTYNYKIFEVSKYPIQID